MRASGGSQRVSGCRHEEERSDNEHGDGHGLKPTIAKMIGNWPFVQREYKNWCRRSYEQHAAQAKRYRWRDYVESSVLSADDGHGCELTLLLAIVSPAPAGAIPGLDLERTDLLQPG